MTLIDYVLGDRAGSYLLASCLLVTALAIIAAIIDIPLRALREAGYAIEPRHRRLLPPGLAQGFGAAMLLTAFFGAATQAYIASSPSLVPANSLFLFLLTNVTFFSSVATWGLAAPLTRHWGLCLGAFGLGLAALFLLLSAVLHLPVDSTGVVMSDPARLLFAATAGAILLALGTCLAAILAMVAYTVHGAWMLATEHSRRTDWLTSDWTVQPRRGAARSAEPRAADGNDAPHDP